LNKNNLDFFDYLNSGILFKSDEEKFYINQKAESFFGLTSGYYSSSKIEVFFQRNPFINKIVNSTNDKKRSILSKQQKIVSADGSDKIVDLSVCFLENNSFIIEFLDSCSDNNHFYWESKIQELNTLAAGLAHEIKNPLGGIKMASQMIKRIDEREKISKYSDIIIEEAEKVNNVVETLMNISKPIMVNQQKINPHIFLDKFIDKINMEINDKNIVIVKDYDPSIDTIIVDTELLSKILFNLFKNSIESSDKSDKIIVRSRVDFNYYKEVSGKKFKMVIISIEDFGKKVTEAEIKKFFTPFYSTKSTGTGLGLVISKHFANLMDCDLSAKRKELGLIFKLTVPAE